MRKINLKDVPEQEKKSPKGKFGRITKNISIALGREPESLDLSKRHPFDLALVRIPKGKTLCPYHAHSAESELYLVVSGRGNVRDKDGITEVGPSDAFLFQPGEAHQLSNAGHVRRCPQHSASRGPCHIRIRGDGLGEAEVEHLHVPRPGHG